MRIIRFEITDESCERLERLKNRTGAKDFLEVLRNALGAYESMLIEQSKGFDVLLVAEGEPTRKIELPVGKKK